MDYYPKAACCIKHRPKTIDFCDKVAVICVAFVISCNINETSFQNLVVEEEYCAIHLFPLINEVNILVKILAMLWDCM